MFNNLHTSEDAKYSVCCGVHASIRSERNIYVGQEAFDIDGSTSDAVLETIEDLFINSTATAGNGTAFTPPYPYEADPTDGLRAIIEANVGPQ